MNHRFLDPFQALVYFDIFGNRFWGTYPARQPSARASGDASIMHNIIQIYQRWIGEFNDISENKYQPLQSVEIAAITFAIPPQ